MTAKSSFFFVAVLVALLLAALAAVVILDGARADRIAQGVKVGGVDVGGLSPAAARARLDQRLVAGLREPVLVRHDTQTFTLGVKEAHLHVNVGELVRQARERSDRGGLFGRTYRRLTGGRVEADLTPRIAFSKRAVDRLVARVSRHVDRPVVEATLQLTLAGVAATESQRGLRVKRGKLRRAVSAALLAPADARRVSAETVKVKPKVTGAELAQANPVVLIADRQSHTLRLYHDLRLEKTYGIATGQPAFPTPAGQFTIQNKQVDPVWSVPNSPWAGELGGTTVDGGTAANPLKARWMGITDGVGIHGTSDDGSIGSSASHGCLRMHVPDVIDLFPRVPVGTKILIA
jgi:lipoprotein-anchoring transpeptidase ErfK/SrfK